MTPAQELVQELADTCIEDDCGYDPLPQHITAYRMAIRDSVPHQEELAEYLQDEFVWSYLAAEALRDNDAARDTMTRAINKLTNAWVTIVLSFEVDKAIDAKMLGWESEPEEDMLDDAGGAL
jgi:hypothetical protein